MRLLQWALGSTSLFFWLGANAESPLRDIFGLVFNVSSKAHILGEAWIVFKNFSAAEAYPARGTSTETTNWMAGVATLVTLICQPAIVREWGPLSRQEKKEIREAEEEARRQA